MAKDTLKILRNKVIYEVYVRNHGINGTFNDVTNDLERIKKLGVDIIWLMPIHPIGKINKKGSYGCPYSISDYTKVNEEYGTLDDFVMLINKVHIIGMQIMIDVVYNHTAHDSVYVTEHPEYYYHNEDGKFGNKIADWSDIIDLDYNNNELWKAQISALEYWTKLGVDGFRCDVASLVPVEFWVEARAAIQKINPSTIMLAETVHPHFLEEVRSNGVYGASDCEVYRAFDICYDYDTHAELQKYLYGEIDLEKYLEKKRIQEYIYPENYVKLRYLENHDQPRIASIIRDDARLKIWTAFLYFEKGTTLLYAGQEAKDNNMPSLFERDLINWEGLDDNLSDFFNRLYTIKKESIFAYGKYKIHHSTKEDVILASYMLNDECIIGIFNVGLKSGEININNHKEGDFKSISIKDGDYINEYNSNIIEIKNQKIMLIDEPIMIRIK